VTSHVMEFVATRNMDGQVVECRATNEMSGNNVTYRVHLDILCKWN